MCIIHPPECAVVNVLKHSVTWWWACTKSNLTAQRSQVNERGLPELSLCIYRSYILIRSEASLTTSSGLHLKPQNLSYTLSPNISNCHRPVPFVQLKLHLFVVKVLQHICRFIICWAFCQLNFVRPRKFALCIHHFILKEKREAVYS